MRDKTEAVQGDGHEEQVLAIVNMNYGEETWLYGEEFRLLTGIADNELLLGRDEIAGRKKENQIDSTVKMVAAGEVPLRSLGQDGIFRSSQIEKKQIALTFDDGPNKKWTEKYLELLKEKEVRATFFMLGKNAETYPELVQKIAADGHDIGIHSYDHNDLKKESFSSIQQDLIHSQDILTQITGNIPSLFRPPYGSIDSQVIQVAQEQGLLVVLWNVDPQDWLMDTKEQVAEAVLSHVKPGNIVVMHEGKSVTYGALPVIIDTLREQGYEFVTISEMIYESCLEQ